MSRPVLLFDVMSTIVYDPFYEVMPEFFDMTLDELIAVKHPTAWVDFEHGRTTTTEFLDGFFRDGRSFDHDEFMRVVRESYRFLDGMETLLGELTDAASDGERIHFATNYPEWFRIIEKKLRLSRFGDWTLVSCELNARKPSTSFFDAAQVKLGGNGRSLLLVDDQDANVEAARQCGLEAVRFHGASSLREFLVDRVDSNLARADEGDSRTPRDPPTTPSST